MLHDDIQNSRSVVLAVHMRDPVIEPPVRKLDWIVLLFEDFHVVSVREIVGEDVSVAFVTSGSSHPNVRRAPVLQFGLQRRPRNVNSAKHNGTPHRNRTHMASETHHKGFGECCPELGVVVDTVHVVSTWPPHKTKLLDGHGRVRVMVSTVKIMRSPSSYAVLHALLKAGPGLWSLFSNTITFNETSAPNMVAFV